MAHWTPEKTLADRRNFEKEAAKALAELAHILMIDYLRGWNGATKKNIRLAEKALDKAYSIHRSVVPVAHVAESKIREVKGDLEGSIESLNEALALDPDLADAYAHKANAHILLGKAEKAPPLLEDAIKHSRSKPERERELGLYYWFMGRAYFNMRNYDQAIHWLTQSRDKRPTTWFTWAHLISAYFLTKPKRLNDARAAVVEYRKRFEADWPLDPNIRKYYDQPKYRTPNALPELPAALKEFLTGLEDAKKNADFP